VRKTGLVDDADDLIAAVSRRALGLFVLLEGDTVPYMNICVNSSIQGRENALAEYWSGKRNDYCGRGNGRPSAIRPGRPTIVMFQRLVDGDFFS